MDQIASFFANVTPAQAELVSSATSLLSVLLAAILAPLVFHLITKKGVTNFEQAIEKVTESASAVRDRTVSMAKNITMLDSKLVEINELLSAVQMNVALAQGKSDEETREIEAREEGAPARQDQDSRHTLKNLWNQVREKLENLASDVRVPGHARARYARIDRRDYRELIRTLDRDGRLGDDALSWSRAVDIWYQYRPNNQPIPTEALAELGSLAQTLSSANYPPPDQELSLADRIQYDALAGRLPAILTPAIVLEHYPDYAVGTAQSVLPGYAEGGYFPNKGQRPRFRKLSEGQYEALPLQSEAA